MLEIVPTKNGKHIITNPFNSQDFKSQYPEISSFIKITLLYYIVLNYDNI